MRHSVLLIDDDTEMSVMLTELFKRESVDLSVAEDGVTGLDKALNGDYELILLDVMLPGIDGMQLLQRLRQQHRDTAVLMLTARGDDDDRVMGLELGADDYLPKPFNPRELIARVRALLRRTPNTTMQNESLNVCGIVLDPATTEVKCDDAELILTPTEFDILRCLMQQAGQMVSKDQLSVAALGRKMEPFDRSLDVHISNIRKKFPAKPDRIQTIRGRGYRLIASL
ncbi:response regulator transcription factor [Idiomarina loihiensis]|jgi:two-component system response regulator CpxR|uniref:Response regulator (CheY,wHTH domains) n=2 Tax=Idiomarina TaxID=135575 RepID=Q5QUX8_IDILO|nr:MULTISPECIES: response regulator transcription factor [Idiomarina]NWO03797.1 response regulator transcription factor [Idiomarinaceae bacterium]AAV83266.1 Response regulator (CheY,wHTH domains) [Idiomarina loihiensis L2TR]AGM37309.1 response regulator [Idiomarina loihiensis GSL 199]MAA62575.1 DNA-binding response regulator [Idiomarina sp.]MBL4855993.1 response regulator transcription factor [Idiomarina sp.]|tara:strand:+ start:13306 stop:13986 length:681 start_codon:yes stop_codon:yes gene_type:complete